VGGEKAAWAAGCAKSIVVVHANHLGILRARWVTQVTWVDVHVYVHIGIDFWDLERAAAYQRRKVETAENQSPQHHLTRDDLPKLI
jgi:hypothetical protein